MSDSMLLQASGTQQFDALEPEDDLDAFNDDTFGGDADEWKEDDHEQLAQLTEQERQALAASNDFFEFGSDDEGDALEPVEPRNGTSSDKAPINQLSKLSLEPEGMAPPPEAVQGPLTIQTSIPVNQVPVVPQQILQPAYIQSQPMAYNLVPPAHFQAGGGGEGLQDPAIMSFSKVPQMPVQLHQVLPQQYQQVQPGGFPAVYQQQPQQQQQQFSSSGFPPGSGQPNFNQQQPASRPAFPQQSQQQFPPQQQGHTSIPPTIMGFKTIQDVEKEMMYGSQAAPAPQPNYMPRNDQQQHQQQHQARQQQQQQMHHQQQMQHQQQQQQHHQRQNHQQQQQQQQQILMNRNLSYPGMRDRQGHQVFNNVNSRNHQENDNQRGHTNQNLNNWQQQQQNNRDHQHNNYNRLHESLRNAGRNNAGREDGRYNNRDGDRYGGGGRNDHYGRGGEDRYGRGGEGDRYGGGRGDNDRFNRDGGGNDRYGGGRDGDRYGNERELDEDSWRWNEVRNRNRDSNTRKDLMPGHVHVLGILRHSRSRHEHSEQHQDDDCLGSAEPLMDPTGDPLLDAKLSKEQAELANRCRYFDETEDEYAGLMSGRDKQFIINIQLSQLKCENPYVDDYYYTMYTAKKQHAENSESTGQMLLSEHGDHDAEYVPTQFSNSLGKLQAVTVKAPRQIIDVGVVRQETLSPTEEEEQHDPGLTVVKDVKRSGDYKAVLLQMERLYSTLLDIESLKLKLAAIPTGAPLREQVTLDLTKQIQALVTGLSKPGLITTYLQVRKGRGLLARCLKHLPGAAASRVSQEMLLHLGLMCREKSGQDAVWIHLHRHLAQCSLSSLETAMSGVCRGKESNLDNVLTSPLGVSTLLAILHRAATAAKRGQEKISVPVWRELILKVLAWRSKGAKVLAAPLLPPQPIDIGFLLTLPQDQMSAWEDFLATVSDDGSRDKN